MNKRFLWKAGAVLLALAVWQGISMLVGIILMVLGLWFLEPIALWLGADASLLGPDHDLEPFP